MTCGIFVFIYNLKVCIFYITFFYYALNVNICLLHLHHISCILHIHALYHIKIITFVTTKSSKKINFEAKSMFEPNVLECVVKSYFSISYFFLFLNINVKILKRNGAHLIRKNDCPFKRFKCFKYAPILFLFSSNFEH